MHPRRPSPLTILACAMAVLTAIPIWITPYLPIEDFPVHAATMRVVHSLHDPRFGLEENFVLTLGRTPYVSYYLAGSALASVFGVKTAHLVLVSAYLAGAPLALQYLLVALGRDRRLSFFSIPLLYNPLFMLGLFPFLLGIPIMLLATGAFLRHARAPGFRHGGLTAVLATGLFYWHVAPFGVFAIAAAALFPWSRRRDWLKAVAPLVPVIVAALAWLSRTDGGSQVLGAVTHGGKGVSLTVALSEGYQWIGDTFRDHADEKIFLAFAAVTGVATFLGYRTGEGPEPLPRRYAMIPIACVLLYVLGGRAHGVIWPLSQRFAILAAFTAIPFVALPEGRRGTVALAALIVVSVASLINTGVHFVRFQHEEVDHYERIVARMEPRKRVAALIFDSASTVAYWHPFLHFVSYYQLEKGGIVQFSFAGYNHWPFDYRRNHYPPPGGPARPRWEWTPRETSTTGELYPYYDYVISRGPGFDPPSGTFHLLQTEGRWTLWERDADRDAPSYP